MPLEPAPPPPVWYRHAPYLLFFPLGALLSLLGVLPWTAFVLGWGGWRPELHAIMDRARHVADPWASIAGYVTDRRGLQFREPAFTDALLMTHPESGQLVALANAATDATVELVRRGHDAAVLRPDFTASDLYYADVANGLALRALPRPSREDYGRRTRFFLDSLRAR